MTSNGYFIGATGTRYAYADIADRIRKDAPHTLGKHIFEQLDAIGLLEEMQNGTTPCGLPYSFADRATRLSRSSSYAGRHWVLRRPGRCADSLAPASRARLAAASSRSQRRLSIAARSKRRTAERAIDIESTRLPAPSRTPSPVDR